MSIECLVHCLAQGNISVMGRVCCQEMRLPELRNHVDLALHLCTYQLKDLDQGPHVS